MPNSNAISSAAQSSIAIPNFPIQLFPNCRATLISQSDSHDKKVAKKFAHDEAQISSNEEIFIEGTRDYDARLSIISVAMQKLVPTPYNYTICLHSLPPIDLHTLFYTRSSCRQKATKQITFE